MITFKLPARNLSWQIFGIAVLSLLAIAGVTQAYTGPNRPDLPPTRWRGHACGDILGGSNGCCNAQWDGDASQFRQSVCGGWANPNNCDCRDFLHGNFDSVSVAPMNGGPQPPATHSGSFSCSNPGNSGWCIAGPAIDFNADEPLSGYEITAIEGDSGILCGIGAPSGSCFWNIPFPDGTYTENHWALSTYGDTSVLATTNFRIDGTPPTISQSVPSPDGSNGWYVSPPTLSVTGTDATSGFDHGEVQVGGSWFSSPYTISTDGTYAVDFRTFDVAGNTTPGSATSISLDATPPTINPQVIGDQSGGFFGKNVTLVVGGADATSGLASEEVSIDGGPWQQPGDFILPDADLTITFRAVDVAGNVATSSINIRVDGTDPQPNVSTSLGACIHGIHTFRGQIKEDLANLAIAQFLWDGTVLGQLNPDRDGLWSFDVNTEKEADGIYQVSAYAEDWAGNKGSAMPVAVTVDNTAPVITLWDTWEAGSYGQLAIEDSLSGLGQIEIFVKGEGLNKKFSFENQNYPGTLYIADYLGSTQIVPPAEVTLEVIAKDLCGNRAQGAATVVFSELEEPITLVETGGDEEAQKPEAEVSEEAVPDEPHQEPAAAEAAAIEPEMEEVYATIVPDFMIDWYLVLPIFVVVFFTGLRAIYDPLPFAWKRRAEQHEVWLQEHPELYLDTLDEF